MAYTSVEAMLYTWFEEKGLYPDKLGRGEIQDLAEKVSDEIMPYRNFYRAYEGHEGYDLTKSLAKAREAEKK